MEVTDRLLVIGVQGVRADVIAGELSKVRVEVSEPVVTALCGDRGFSLSMKGALGGTSGGGPDGEKMLRMGFSASCSREIVPWLFGIFKGASIRGENGLGESDLRRVAILANGHPDRILTSAAGTCSARRESGDSLREI